MKRTVRIVDVSHQEEGTLCSKGLADEMCGGRLVLTLEGGYNLKALAYGVKATFDVLLGNPIDDPIGDPPYRGRAPSIDQLLDRIKKIHQLSDWKRANPHEYPEIQALG